MIERESGKPAESVEQQAAAWVLRCDRGLTAAEQDELSEWLSRDSRHGAQLARLRGHWSRLDQLVEWCPTHSMQPNPNLLAPPLHRRFQRLVLASVSLATAAAVLFAVWLARPVKPANPGAEPSLQMAQSSDGRRLLDDGSVVELHGDAALEVEYGAADRRVRLVRGEAHFVVAKDPARPFVVTAGGVDVRAIGTAFNVRLDAAVVEVLVTAGRVQVGAPGASAPLVPMLAANYRAVLSRSPGPAAPQIALLTPGEIQRVLSWQHRMLNFTAAPLAEIAAEFNRRNPLQIVVVDPDLAATRISASFRSDNVEGFIRLLEAGFDAEVERRGPAEILLRKAR